MCFQCMVFVCKMYKPMNEQILHNFIINLLHAKFMMCFIQKHQGYNLLGQQNPFGFYQWM